MSRSVVTVAPRVSFKTVPEGADWSAIQDLWCAAEESGFFHAGWLPDHLTALSERPKPWLDCWSLLAALAATTTRLRLGSMASPITYRHPVLLARNALTIDHISGGRVEVGVGLGWHLREHNGYGFQLGTRRERSARLDETCALLDTMMRGSSGRFEGPHFRFEDDFALPPRQQPRPPIAIGGSGKKSVLPVVARWADQWNYLAGDADDFSDRIGELRVQCLRLGRALSEIELTVEFDSGDVRDVADVTPFLEAGATHVVFATPYPFDLDTVFGLTQDLRASPPATQWQR